MKTSAAARILPMARSHIPACARIVAASDPWKRLTERFDFAYALSPARSYIKSYVYTVDRRAVGFIVFTPNPVFARGGYLRAIGVAPGMRRQGIGKKLMAFAEKTTARHSPNFYLCVSSFNRRAQAFYKALGYIRVGKIPGLIIPGSSEYIFWKRLGQQPQKMRKR